MRAPLVLLLTVTGAALLAGCGGSVADRDRAAPARTPAPVSSPFCDALQASLDATAPLEGRNGVPPEELSNAVDGARAANDDLVDTAPGEIRGDVEQYVRALDLQLDALLANGGDTQALSTDAALTSAVNAPETVAAGQRVRAYVQRTCAPAS